MEWELLATLGAYGTTSDFWNGRTFRNRIKLSALSADKRYIRLTFKAGGVATTIGAASLGVTSAADNAMNGPPVKITFNGLATRSLAIGEECVTDPIELPAHDYENDYLVFNAYLSNNGGWTRVAATPDTSVVYAQTNRVNDVTDTGWEGQLGNLVSKIEGVDELPQPSAHRYWRLTVVSTNGSTNKYTRVGDLEFAGVLGGPDLTDPALATARAYSTHGTAREAFDEIITNRWDSGSGGLPKSVRWDFVEPVAIAEARFYLTGGDAIQYATVDYSDDDVTWTPAFCWFGTAPFSTYVTMNAAIEYNLLRVNVSAVVDPTYNILIERIKFLLGGVDTLNPARVVIYSRQANVTTNFALNAFADNTNIWSSGGAAPHWIGVTSPTPITLDSVSIKAGNTADRTNGAPTAFTIERSTNGLDWEVIATVETPATWGISEERVFAITQSVSASLDTLWAIEEAQPVVFDLATGWTIKSYVDASFMSAWAIEEEATAEPITFDFATGWTIQQYVASSLATGWVIQQNAPAEPTVRLRGVNTPNLITNGTQSGTNFYPPETGDTILALVMHRSPLISAPEGFTHVDTIVTGSTGWPYSALSAYTFIVPEGYDNGYAVTFEQQTPGRIQLIMLTLYTTNGGEVGVSEVVKQALNNFVGARMSTPEIETATPGAVAIAAFTTIQAFNTASANAWSFTNAAPVGYANRAELRVNAAIAPLPPNTPLVVEGGLVSAITDENAMGALGLVLVSRNPVIRTTLSTAWEIERDANAGAKFWRFLITEIKDPGNISYAYVSDMLFETYRGSGQLAIGGTAIGSSDDPPAALAFDGDPNTLWNNDDNASSSAPAWIGYEFAQPVNVGSLSVTVGPYEYDDEAPTRGAVEYSDDGVTWMHAFDVGPWTWSGTLPETNHAGTAVAPVVSHFATLWEIASDLRFDLATAWLIDAAIDTSRVVIPDYPVTELWTFQTQIFRSRSGKEERRARVLRPVVTQQFSAPSFIEDDFMATRRVLEIDTEQFYPIPLFQYYAYLEQDAPAGTDRLRFNMTRTNIVPGQHIAIMSDPEIEIVRVTEIHEDGVTITPALVGSVTRDYSVCPVVYSRLGANASTSHSPVHAMTQFNFVSAQRELDFVRPGNDVELVMFGDMPLMPFHIRANSNVSETLLSGNTTIDNARANPVQFVKEPTRKQLSLSFLINRETEPQRLDFWRKFFATIRGQQKAFALPTYRPDAYPVEPVEAGAQEVRLSGRDFFEIWQRGGYVGLAFGTRTRLAQEVARVLSVKAVGGNTVCELAAPIIGEDYTTVSFVMSVRCSSDQVTLTHTDFETVISFPVVMVQE